jgi:hypothetical protein
MVPAPVRIDVLVRFPDDSRPWVVIQTTDPERAISVGRSMLAEGGVVVLRVLGVVTYSLDEFDRLAS